MSRVDAAAPMDRLPWLSDEPQPRPTKRRGGSVVGWAAATIVLVAGASYWIGTRSVEEQTAPRSRQAPPSTTVVLPEPRPGQPQVSMPAEPQVNPAPQPQVHPAPAREVRISAPPAPRAVPRDTEEAASAPPEQAKTETPAAAPVTAPAAQFVPPKPWEPRDVSGAAGRIVQIGAFGSTPQAKRGWWFMVRAYPAVAHLPAVVRPTRNSKGRVFYRFRVGTTSQAHSEILCQRMQKIGLSCAVVGLPWKAKVER